MPVGMVLPVEVVFPVEAAGVVHLVEVVLVGEGLTGVALQDGVDFHAGVTEARFLCWRIFFPC